MDRFAFYHQNEALLFQFLLDECLSTYQQLLRNPDEELMRELLDPIPTQWQPKIGHFQKIDLYYSLFAAHFPERLSEDSEKRLTALRQSLKNASLPEVKKEIKEFTTLFIDQLPALKDHEPILFFILKRNQQFDEMLGKGFTAKTMGSLFPNGIQEAKTRLEKWYTEKGFNHVLPTIERKIAAIQ